MPADPSRPQVWLLGMPVKHSLSPSFQNAGLHHLGLDWDYTLRPVSRDELPDVLARIRAGDLVRGANVTVPHKEAVAELVDELGEDARCVGAVNTVVPRGGRLIGYNTDVFGFQRLLEEAVVGQTGRCALVLGAGGASRAVVVALARLGVPWIVVANRSVGRAEALVAELGPGLGARLEAVALDQLTGIQPPDLIVHTTSLGVGTSPGEPGFMEAVQAWSRLPWAGWPAVGCVVDICYGRIQTPMVALAHQMGLEAVDGLDMLLYQGTRALELWTQRPAPVLAMRDALYRAVGR